MKYTIKIVICLVGLVLVWQDTLVAETFPTPKTKFNPRHYICYRSTGDIVIDGKIDEKDWKTAEWTEYFVDIEGDLKPKPTHNTRVKMLWDEEYFYFAAYLEEPHVWAKLRQRDTVIYYDNDFEIFIDPDGDTHEYYEYEVNAFNTVWDLLITRPYRDGAAAIFNWDIKGLKSAVYVDGTINDPSDRDKGWFVEVAYPWSVLKECARRATPPNNNDQWRVNFSRVQWQMEIKNNHYKKAINPETGKHYHENNWVWSQQGIIAMHYPERWGIVQFSENGVDEKGANFIEKEYYQATNHLYELYYAQRQYFMDHGKYCDKIGQLYQKKVALKDYAWPPKIEVTSRGFDITLNHNTNEQVISINEKGKLTTDK